MHLGVVVVYTFSKQIANYRTTCIRSLRHSTKDDLGQSSFMSAGYPEQLSKGARSLGFEHCVVPSPLPTWPATLAQNSGLLILSKRPIACSASLSFGLSLEAGGVNRGALYARLEDGTHIVTCHVAPGLFVFIFENVAGLESSS